ncbi:hypothetical protein Hanom_Chr12g01088491 [Helianthus anomalus]
MPLAPPLARESLLTLCSWNGNRSLNPWLRCACRGTISRQEHDSLSLYKIVNTIIKTRDLGLTSQTQERFYTFSGEISSYTFTIPP